MASRPTVSIRSASGEASGSLTLPAVLTAPIRLDVVQQVHKSIAKTSVKPTPSLRMRPPNFGRVLGYWSCCCRIPRVGRWRNSPFRPGRLWKHVPWWSHVRPNQDLAQMARQGQPKPAPLCRCFGPRSVCPPLARWLAATALGIDEVPLVVSSSVESYTKTKEAVTLLKSRRAYQDVVKVSNSRKLRAGVGKIRNRRHRQRRGPLVVYAEDNGISRAFRNLPGVEVANVLRRPSLAGQEAASPLDQHKNPLVNKGALYKLNPYAKTLRRQELLKQNKKKDGSVKATKAVKSAGEAFLSTLLAP
ncbi:ribosomal protein S12/S23 [Ceratobasidium sp. AG-Ba]|nr:ribosomal protein S12/S23 [Ceratobasidium sp. AG-Ba]